jgi:hypothetical protein
LVIDFAMPNQLLHCTASVAASLSVAVF